MVERLGLDNRPSVANRAISAPWLLFKPSRLCVKLRPSIEAYIGW